MIGFKAEVLALFSDVPMSRQTVLNMFPKSIDPDAVHKAIYELKRANVISISLKGIVLTPPSPNDYDVDVQCKKTGGSKIGQKKTTLPRYNPIGHRLCTHCVEYLPVNLFRKMPGSTDGLRYYCISCQRKLDNARRKRRFEAKAATAQ